MGITNNSEKKIDAVDTIITDLGMLDLKEVSKTSLKNIVKLMNKSHHIAYLINKYFFFFLLLWFYFNTQGEIIKKYFQKE